MKTIGKTKILRCIGREVYFKRVQLSTGELRWERMVKDLSALCRAWQDKKFSSDGTISEVINPMAETSRPIPADFATDLLGPYAPVQYAAGHAPAKPFSLSV